MVPWFQAKCADAIACARSVSYLAGCRTSYPFCVSLPLSERNPFVLNSWTFCTTRDSSTPVSLEMSSMVLPLGISDRIALANALTRILGTVSVLVPPGGGTGGAGFGLSSDSISGDLAVPMAASLMVCPVRPSRSTSFMVSFIGGVVSAPKAVKAAPITVNANPTTRKLVSSLPSIGIEVY